MRHVPIDAQVVRAFVLDGWVGRKGGAGCGVEYLILQATDELLRSSQGSLRVGARRPRSRGSLQLRLRRRQIAPLHRTPHAPLAHWTAGRR